MDYTKTNGYVTDASGRRQLADRDLANNVPGTDASCADLQDVINSLMYVILGMAGLQGNAADDTLIGQAIAALISTAVSAEAASRASGDTDVKNWASDQLSQEAYQRKFEDDWLQNYFSTQLSQEASAREFQDNWLQNTFVPSYYLALAGGTVSGDLIAKYHISVNTNGVAWGGNQTSGDNPVGAGADGWYADGRSVYHFSSGSIPMYLGTGVSGGPIVSFCASGGNAIGGIVNNGSSVAFNTTSDYRVKVRVAPLKIGAAEARIRALRPVSHGWVSEPKARTHGFIAHELQQVAPYAVTGKKDATDDDGKPLLQQVDLTKLVPDLVAALQGAFQQIDDLTARLNRIEQGVK
ncbi:tail fiber domain-containing protein [Gluconobacter cerinus]|uniref:tail fiber domain-containing protein n=1 Tax=Gluconobacter cerinus TaxID=38307 RepID=UPI001B8C7513|nr:tail fiber domain-containing protein [Gluconobacter cerinus]MBS0995861.1 tail fiber domain-containing protein [Gluconobacter cerinus]